MLPFDRRSAHPSSSHPKGAGSARAGSHTAQLSGGSCCGFQEQPCRGSLSPGQEPWEIRSGSFSASHAQMESWGEAKAASSLAPTGGTAQLRCPQHPGQPAEGSHPTQSISLLLQWVPQLQPGRSSVQLVVAKCEQRTTTASFTVARAQDTLACLCRHPLLPATS